MDKNKEEWIGSEDWNKLCGLIGFHPLDGRLVLICKIIESEKEKSREEGYQEGIREANNTKNVLQYINTLLKKKARLHGKS